MTDCLTYGKALYELASENSLDETIKDELNEVLDVIKKNPEIIPLLDCPGIPLEERLNIVLECFSTVHKYIINFIKILTEDRSMLSFSKCVDSYNAVYDTAHCIEYVTAVTVIPLTDDEINRLTFSLQKKRGTNIVIENVIDKSILGGIILRFPDSQTDASLSGRLNKAKDKLKSITI